MAWYGWLAAGATVLLAAYLTAGYLLFRYLCLPKKKTAEGAETGEGRALKAYVPLIRQRAQEIAQNAHELVSIRSFDGLTLRAKLYPNRKTDRIVLLVHGYQSSTAWDFGASFASYRRAGYTILAVDNRAHGASEGRFIGFGALDQRDVCAWMGWLVARFGGSCKIALVGVSMGGATVLLASGNHPIDQLACVVEDCGYTSLYAVVESIISERGYPGHVIVPAASLWCRLLAGYFFSDANAKKAVRRSHTPTLFLHGTADRFVPFRMHAELYDACAAPKERAVFEDAVHGESSYRYPERYEAAVLPFLERFMDES